MRNLRSFFLLFLVCVLFSFSLCKQSHVSSSSLSHNKHFDCPNKNFGVCFAKKGKIALARKISPADLSHTHTHSLSLCVCVCVRRKETRNTPATTTLCDDDGSIAVVLHINN